MNNRHGWNPCDEIRKLESIDRSRCLPEIVPAIDARIAELKKYQTVKYGGYTFHIEPFPKKDSTAAVLDRLADKTQKADIAVPKGQLIQ